MVRRGVFWIVLIAAIMLLCFIVPFTALSGVDAWYGSFLFWVVATLAVIVINVVITGSWRE